MMTNEATPPATVRDGVPWGKLHRRTMHRTSAPTDEEVRAALFEVTQARGVNGRAPAVDAVIFAAVAIARRDLPLLFAEIGRVEAGTYREAGRSRGGTPGN